MRALITFFFIAILSVGASMFAWSQGINWFTQPGPLTQDEVFLVERGATLSGVAEKLEADGLITSAFWFTLFARVRDEATSLKAGEFLVPAAASPEEVLRILTEGDNQLVVDITMPEGWTSWQFIQRLEAAERFAGTVAELPPEGSLLPETYRFNPNTPRSDVIARLQASMSETLAQLWATRAADLPFSTPQEAVILASIIERETGVASERGLVASVMVNRLNIGMPLQMDSTIEYGLTLGQGTLGRGLRRSEIDDADNPYNTYQHRGLPPGPIANPGRAALEAVLNPPTSDYLYFVANGEGGHNFARTLQEHNRNVAAWRASQQSGND